MALKGLVCTFTVPKFVKAVLEGNDLADVLAIQNPPTRTQPRSEFVSSAPTPDLPLLASTRFFSDDGNVFLFGPVVAQQPSPYPLRCFPLTLRASLFTVRLVPLKVVPGIVVSSDLACVGHFYVFLVVLPVQFASCVQLVEKESSPGGFIIGDVLSTPCFSGPCTKCCIVYCC